MSTARKVSQASLWAFLLIEDFAHGEGDNHAPGLLEVAAARSEIVRPFGEFT